jgi:hypothetical protein
MSANQTDASGIGQAAGKGTTSAVWITGAGLALLASILIRGVGAASLVMDAAWLEGTIGYAIGITLFPLIVCAFTRFRRPWLFVGLTGLAALCAYVGTTSHASDASPTATRTARADWEPVSSRFVANHPALQNGEDRMIFREKYDRDDSSLSTQELLEKAYQEAKSDPRWVDVR